MSKRTTRAWAFIHTWTSLVCTGFVLMLCLTGLPLIFHDEIDTAFSTAQWTPANPEGPLLSYDRILEIALEARPGDYPLYMSFDTDRPVINVTTGPAPDAPAAQMHFASFDRTSGDLVPPASDAGGVMDFILQIHTDMFLGLPGMLFLGGMGFLFILAIVSGVVLYAPYMRKHDFGMIRTRRSSRVRWLDLHNLLGIVTVAWAIVVGFTGLVNTLETPINDVWKASALADLTSGYDGQNVPENLSPLGPAIDQSIGSAPGMQLQFVAFPGGAFSTDHHYAVFFHGDTPLTEHIITPALIDARTGEFAGLRQMPWYAKGLSLSRPLHFGDYGGLPLKILWAILDLFTIIVLASGLYLWVKRRTRRTRLQPAAGALARPPESQNS